MIAHMECPGCARRLRWSKAGESAECRRCRLLFTQTMLCSSLGPNTLRTEASEAYRRKHDAQDARH